MAKAKFRLKNWGMDMFSRATKITTLFWIAILGVILTTIYTIVIMIQGSRTMKMIRYMYNQHKKRGEQENRGE
ncbi:hypothetical protein [Bacillus sp. JJ1533]|uniref:hypothetical protein n=1 Tax=Bacillus sp. JJ1533 TaxID=3122959 RepID=UPI002FFF27AC